MWEKRVFVFAYLVDATLQSVYVKVSARLDEPRRRKGVLHPVFT